MDFLRIRKKAKERAAARERERPAGDAGGAPDRGGAPRAAGADPVLTDADVLEGKLAAELRWPEPPPPPRGPPPPPGEGFVIAARGAPAAVPEPPRDPLGAFFYREDEPGSPILELGLAAAAVAPSEPAEPRRAYLAFFLGDEEYALELGCLREILRPPPIAEVPRAPRDVLGVVTVRGEVIAVLDPRRRLELPPAGAAAPARIVVCDVGEGPVGLLVDRVTQVVRLEVSAVEPRPRGVGAAGSEVIAGIGRLDDRLLVLLDAPALLGGRVRAEAAEAVR